MRDLSGQQVKGYVIQEQIGIGGFAVVYRARQPSVGREVAVKVILPKYANNPDFVRRFETEAQLIARLEHLHIVPLYDFWREPDNAYLVMRWLRGGTLYDSLHDGAEWTLEQIARLLDQVAAALTVAHRNGVIHQDLTPANILFDEERNAYLADFGIAKDLVAEEEAGEGERLVFGAPAYMAPEQITRGELSPQTDIYSLGIVLFQMLTGQTPFDAPTHTTVIRQQVQLPMPPLQSVRSDLPVELNMVVMRAAAKQPGHRYPDALRMALDFRKTIQMLEGREITGARSSASTPQGTLEVEVDASQTLEVEPVDFGTLVMEPVNPYKGLRAFDEADANHFFGRQTVIDQLCQRIADMPEDARLLAVIGPSGSGKSSLVRAGVLPALRGGAIPGSKNWFFAKMMPGAFPLAELEMALLGVSFEPAESIPALLHDKNAGLAAAVNTLLPDDGSELVLVIDQFEEIYTQVSWEQERNAFLSLLARAATAPDSRLRIIITLRADFYDRPLLHPEFGALVRQNTEVVLPLAPSELRAAITHPAERAGLVVEDGLVDVIVENVEAQPGALPLLQYALTELYERRQGVVLTLNGYRDSGGVLGALARRAEEVYLRLAADQQVVVKQLLLRLVSLGDQAVDTRRRVSLAELFSMEGVPRDEMQAVLDEFGRYRLLTFDHDPQTREPTVEVAHEALLREWDRLQTWLDESRDSIRVQRQLAAAAEEWLAAGDDTSFLVSGARLEQFEALAESQAVALTAQEQRFLAHSIQQRVRNNRRRQAFIVALIVVALFMSGLAIFALDRQNRAEDAQATSVAERDRANDQAQISRSQALAITSLTAIDQPDYALLLGVEALHTANTYDARNSLLSVLLAHRRLAQLLYDHAAPVRCVAYSPDGRWFATGDKSGQVLVWDADTHDVVATAPVSAVTAEGETVEVAINSVAFSPDGTLLAVGSGDGRVQLWDVTAQAWSTRALAGHEAAVWSVVFSPDGTRLASAGADALVRLWDVESGVLVGDPLAGHGDLVFSVAFSPDGTLLASGSADSTVRLWDVATGDPVGDPLLGHTNWVFSVAFSTNGALLVSGGADNVLRLWDVATGDPVGEPLEGHSDWVRSVAFTPTGLLASGSADGTLRLWDLNSGRSETLTGHQDAVWGIAFDPAGERLVSAGEDTVVGVWDTLTTSLHYETLVGHTEAANGVAFSPDGRWVASGGGEPLGRGQDNVARVWDVATGDVVVELAGHQSAVTGTAFSPSGDSLATISIDGTAILWNTATWEMFGEPLSGQNAVLMSLTFSPDGAVLVTGGSDGSVVAWDTRSGERVAGPLYGHTGGVLSLTTSPDGRWLASAGEDNMVRLWTMEPFGLQDDIMLTHTDVVSSVVFGPPGGPAEGLLVTGSRDAAIRLWAVDTWDMVGDPLIGHTRRVTALAFNADGTLLASGSQDATIQLWDMTTRRTLGEALVGHTDWISGLAFSPTGLLASASWDARVVLWTASLEAWQTRACEIANRELTPGEWARVLPTVAYHPTCASVLAAVGD